MSSVVPIALSEREASAFLGLSVRALRTMRQADRAAIAANRAPDGPRFRFSRYERRRLVYMRSDLEAWQARQRRRARHGLIGKP